MSEARTSEQVSHGTERNQRKEEHWGNGHRRTFPVFECFCRRCGWIECRGMLSRLTTFERLHAEHAND